MEIVFCFFATNNKKKPRFLFPFFHRKTMAIKRKLCYLIIASLALYPIQLEVEDGEDDDSER